MNETKETQTEARRNVAPNNQEVFMTNSLDSRSFDSSSNAANRRLAVNRLALEILRQGSSLMTMAEAVVRASAQLSRARA